MKRFDLVQVAIIIAGIYSGFSCITLLPGFFYYLLTWFSDGLAGGFMMRYFIQSTLLLIVYLLFALISIRNSKQIAEWLNDKTGLGGDINFSLDVRQLLFALFVAFGVYGLIWNLPQLVADTYNYFKVERSSGYEPVPSTINKNQLFNQLGRIALFFGLIVYANVFSQFFAAKMRKSEPSAEAGDKLI